MNVKRGKRAIRRSNMKRFKRINWKAATAAILVTLLAWGAWQYLSTKTNQAKTLKVLEAKEIQLDKQKKEIQQSNKSVEDIKKELEKIKSEKAEVEKQLEAKRNTPKVYAEAAQEPVQAVVSYESSCGDPKSCIYDKESGNNPAAMNSIGCYGIGQDCNGIVLNQCGTDYACQDAYFTDYMSRRYGTWEHAWEVWQQQKWW